MDTEYLGERHQIGCGLILSFFFFLNVLYWEDVSKILMLLKPPVRKLSECSVLEIYCLICIIPYSSD